MGYCWRYRVGGCGLRSPQMIATPLLSTVVTDTDGNYPTAPTGNDYSPVTIPTAYPYAIPAPSTAQAQQVAPMPSVVPLNAYIATSPLSVSSVPTLPNGSATASGDCGCSGSRPLQWYEILTAVALVVIAVTAFTRR